MSDASQVMNLHSLGHSLLDSGKQSSGRILSHAYGDAKTRSGVGTFFYPEFNGAQKTVVDPNVS